MTLRCQCYSVNITITTLEEEGKMHLKRMMLNERTSKKRGHIFFTCFYRHKVPLFCDDRRWIRISSQETNRGHSVFLVTTIVKCVKSQCQVPRALKPYRKNGCQLQLLASKRNKNVSVTHWGPPWLVLYRTHGRPVIKKIYYQ